MNTEKIIKILEAEYGYTFSKETKHGKRQFDWLYELIKDTANVVKNNAALPHVSGSSLFVIELSDGELKIVTKDELDKMYDGAMEFDGFLGYMVKGRLM